MPAPEISRVVLAFKYGGTLQTRDPMKRFRDRLIAWWTGYDYCHCELLFMLNDERRFTVEVNQGRPVICIPNKRYAQIEWKFHDLKMAAPERRSLWQFCATETAAQRPYNQTAWWWNFTPIFRLWPINNRGSVWFCSEFILRGLQVSQGKYLNKQPHRTSPDDLHKIIQADSGSQVVGGGLRVYSNGHPVPQANTKAVV